MANDNQILMNVEDESISGREKVIGKFPVVVNYPRIAPYHRIICELNNSGGIIPIPPRTIDPEDEEWEYNVDVPRRIDFEITDADPITITVFGKNARGKDITEEFTSDVNYSTKDAFLFISHIDFGELSVGGTVTAMIGSGFGLPYDLAAFKVIGVSLQPNDSGAITPVNEGEITVDEEYDVVEISFDTTNYNALEFFLTGEQIYNAEKHPTELPSVPVDFQGEEMEMVNRLTWGTPTSGSPISEFNIYRAVEGETLVLYDTINSSILTYDDVMEEVEVGIAFDYAVSVVNELGEGPLTDIVTLTALPSHWTLLDTTTGRTLGLAMSENGEYIILGSNGVTEPVVQISSDDGETWTPLPELGTNMLYHCAYMSRSGQYMVVCETGVTGNDYLWMSTNYGAPGSWARNMTLKGGAPGAFWGCSISDDGQVILVSEGSYLGATSQAFVSVDGGVNWTTTTGPLLYCYRCDMSSDGQYMVLAVGAGMNQLRLSTDSGTTWNPVGPVDNYFDVGISDDGQKIIASSLTDTYLSVNGGVSFTSIGIGSVGNSSRACDMSRDGSVMLAIGGGLGSEKVYLSTDGGSTWNPQTVKPGTKLMYMVDVNHDGSFAMALSYPDGGLWSWCK